MSNDGNGSTRRDFLVQGTVVAAALAGCTSGEAVEQFKDGGGAHNVDLDGGAQAGADGSAPDSGEPDAGVMVEPPEGLMESAFFPLGIASGDVTATSAVLWARYLGEDPLKLVVWRMEGNNYAQTVAQLEPTADASGFVHAAVDGLQPGERYRYVFLVQGMPVTRSGIGRFRAALAPDALTALTIGAVSCTRNGRDLKTLQRAAEREDLDVFLLLGDTTYNDGSENLQDFRRHWTEQFSTDAYRALRASTSVLATWDDHEVTDNWNPESINAQQLAYARQTFFEHLPLRRHPDDPDRVWKKLSWGRTADIFVLDGRGERKPSTRSSPQAEYLSRAQFDWLTAELQASQAAFKVIMNSVPIGAFPPLFDVAGRDRWEGYAAQRTAILGFVEQHEIGGVLWISGDFHLASMGRVSPSGIGANALEFLVGPGAQSPNPLATTLASREQWDWSSGENNYAALHLDPAHSSVRVVYHDGDGGVITERTYTV